MNMNFSNAEAATVIQLWHFSLPPGCSVHSDINQMGERIFKITPKMSQQPCHSSHVHTHSANA